MFDLTGQTAIVTGAATGIGEAVAVRLAVAGARVVVADINLSGAEAAAGRIGGGAFPIHTDVSQPDSICQAVASVLRETGRIDILVNNAGIAGTAAPNLGTDLTGLERRNRDQSKQRLLLLP